MRYGMKTFRKDRLICDWEKNKMLCTACNSITELKNFRGMPECPSCGEPYNNISNNSRYIIEYGMNIMSDNKIYLSLVFGNYKHISCGEEDRLDITMNIATGENTIIYEGKEIKLTTFLKNLVLNWGDLNIFDIAEIEHGFSNAFDFIETYNREKYNVKIPKKKIKKVFTHKLQGLLLFNAYPFIDSRIFELLTAFDIDNHDCEIAHDTRDIVKEFILKNDCEVNKTTRRIVFMNQKYPLDYSYGFLEASRNMKHIKSYLKIYKLLISTLSIDNVNKIIFNKNMGIHVTTDISTVFTSLLFTTEQKNRFCNIIKDVYLDGCKEDRDYLIDTIQTLRLISEKEGSDEYKINLKGDMKTIHDKVASDYLKMKHRNSIIRYPDDFNLNYDVNDNYCFVMAKDTHTLLDVGSKMRICVGSYGDMALKGRCSIVLLYNKKNMDKPEVCIEIRDDRTTVNQAKAFANSSPANELQLIIWKWMRQFKLKKGTWDLKDYKSLIKDMNITEEDNGIVSSILNAIV